MPDKRQPASSPRATSPSAKLKHAAESLAPENDAEVLRLMVEGTVRATGAEFFESLVKYLAMAIDAQYAFVAEFAGIPTRVRTVAFWMKDRIGENIEWDLAGTPCEDVVRGRLCHHPAGVAHMFPEDRPLEEMRIESYLGVPLFDQGGQVLGHLAVFDERPMPEQPRRVSIFRIFAERAAAELERLRMQERIEQSERQFRDLFEEAPIPYVYEGTDTRFISANRAFIELLGLKPGDVPGTFGLSLVAKTPDSQTRVHESLAAEQVGQQRDAIELELRRKDNGQSVWVQRWSRPEPDGKHTRTMIIDITARVLAERERNRLQAQNLYLQEEIKTTHNFEEIIGRSPAIARVLKQVQQVAPADSTVLISGETGTGKELIARATHSTSRRKERPLIKLNCAALPTGLVESELFGHERGAFTGALEKRVGRFALADKGSIFLDEIGELSLETQAKLLRILQEQEFEPVGSAKTFKVDVRVIAATNRDLLKAVEAGTFRADLFYRLNVFQIPLPALRERKDDIPLLVHYFATRYAAKLGKRFEGIDEPTLRRLVEYPWPGNIRELENVIERATILSSGPMLEIETELLRAPHAPAERQLNLVSRSSQEPMGAAATTHATSTLAEVERQQILRALRQTRGVIDGERGAAKVLGLNPNTLRSRMKKMGIAREHIGM
jgi:formate hydrogenlyase transcriptional activator